MLRLSKEVVSFVKPTKNQSFSIYNLLEIKLLIPFLANAPLLFSQKISRNRWFFGVFWGYKMVKLAWNKLID